MAVTESTPARLRVATPSTPSVMTNGTNYYDQLLPNGKADASKTNGALDFLRSSIRDNAHPSIEDLFMLLLQEQKASTPAGGKPEYDWIKEMIQRSLQKPDQYTSNITAKVTSPGPQLDTPKIPTLVTNLGSHIINSADEPVAAVACPPALPSIHGVAGSDDPRAAAANGSVVAVDATAPKFQSHASTWQSVIDAGRNAAPLTVNGQILRDPSLIVVDTNNQLVHLPLSLAVDSQSISQPLTNKIKPVVSTLFTKSVSGVATPQANAAVEIPHVLLKENLASNESHTVPAGFVLSGTIKLFGGKIEAQRYTFHGIASDDEKAELAVISQSPIAMDDLIQPSGFTFGSLMLQHPSIEVLSKPTAAGKNAGLWLNATVTLDGSLAETSSILKDIFATDVPSLNISVQLGGYQGLGDFIKPPNDVAVTADLVGLDVKLGGFVELTSAKVQVRGIRVTSGYSWTVQLDGTALLTVPGSAGPLAATYSITKAQSTYKLALKLVQKEWTDAMGVPGFHLNDTMVNASFTKETQNSAFLFDITASIALDTTVVNVSGHYSKDSWDFHASVGDFTLQKLESTFTKLFKTPLLHCDHDVTFTGLVLDVISQDKTLSFTGGVTIDTYTAASASLKLSPTGVHLVGNLTQATFDKVTLTKAQLDLVITKSGLVDPNPKTPGTTAAFTITGIIQIGNAVTVDAQVTFAKAAGAGLVWVVYAKAATNLNLSKFVAVPKDLDFQLESVVAMASNTDDGKLFPDHVFDYAVKKGFHLRARLDCPDHLAKTMDMKSTPPKLGLQLDLSSAQQEVEFSFSTDQKLTLKPGMVAPSVKAGIMLTGNPQIFVEGNMEVQLSGQPGPLDFALRIQAGATEAQGSVALKTDWVNPFNISKKVTVLAPVTVGVIIDYAALTYPSGLSFQGGLQVGETKLNAAFEVGQNPEDGVLLVHAQNLGLRDIVSFVSLVIEHDLPLPPNDFLYFKDLYLGISSGGTIGSVFYPPGVTFNADMMIFGKEAKVHCAVDKKLPGMQIAAEIDAFQLGALVVSGQNGRGTNPKFDLEFGTKLQQLSINGKIQLFDSDIAANIQVVMAPPRITFDAELKFSDLLTFKIDATAAGEIKSIKDVVKADFTLYALLEQKILDYMMALANTYIATAKKASDEGFESANAKLNQVQQQYDAKIASAQRDLDHAQAIWNQKSQAVHQQVENQKNQIKADEAAKRAAVDSAQQAYNNKIDSLTRSLQQTKNDAAARIQAANQQLTDTRNRVNNNINDAKNKLDQAQANMRNSFGSAEQQIRNAANNVDAAQRTVNGLNAQIADCDNRINHGGFPDRIQAGLQRGPLTVALGAATAALATANGVLSAAQAVVHSAGYAAAQGAIAAAQGSLDVANSTAQTSIAAASGALSVAQAAGAASVSAAQSALDTAKTSCQELHVFDAAKATLSAFLATEQAALTAADNIVQDLSKCAEKAAFDAASVVLDAARSATKELDAAKAIVNAVKSAADEFAGFGQWLLKHAGNIFNVKKVEISGSLNDASNKRPFMAHIVGTFADAPIDVKVEFTPGQAEAFVKGLVMGFVDDAKKDLTKYIKAL